MKLEADSVGQGERTLGARRVDTLGARRVDTLGARRVDARRVDTLGARRVDTLGARRVRTFVHPDAVRLVGGSANSVVGTRACRGLEMPRSPRPNVGIVIASAGANALGEFECECSWRMLSETVGASCETGAVDYQGLTSAYLV